MQRKRNFITYPSFELRGLENRIVFLQCVFDFNFHFLPEKQRLNSRQCIQSLEIFVFKNHHLQ